MSVLSLICGFTSPRCSIVARLPLNIPPIPPLTVNMGGNRARIHDEVWNWGEKIDKILPANRLIKLKLKASRV